MAKIKYGRLRCCSVGLFVALAASAKPALATEAANTKGDVAATIGDAVITLRDLDKRALKSNMKLAQSLYDARRTALDQIILERALSAEAASSGVALKEVIRRRIAEKTTPVTPEEVKAFYESNKARLRGRTLEQSSGQIRTYLIQQRQQAAKASLLAQVKQKTAVRVMLGPPRVEVVVNASEPAKGPVEAKVTIVEFSDFQ